jgi:hypothetical protein
LHKCYRLRTIDLKEISTDSPICKYCNIHINNTIKLIKSQPC